MFIEKFDVIIVSLGIWFVQDGLASIAFYPNEKWLWNHTARLIRVCMGITLVVMGVMI